MEENGTPKESFLKKHPKISTGIIAAITFCLGLFVSSIGDEFIDRKIKPLIFATKPEIIFYSTSTTTLEPSYSINGISYYYEITSFMIDNVGDHSARKGDKIKIQASGQILGISPNTLDDVFSVNEKDKTTAEINLEGLGPDSPMKGEIHSLSNMFKDRNETQIGIDPIGDYELIGPNSL